MSNKTLSVKKPSFVEGEKLPLSGSIDAVELVGAAVSGSPVVQTFTAAQLRAMLAEMEPADVDSTMDLPTGTIPAHLIADKSTLPPVGERTASSIQPPAKLHGRFDINGIPVFAPGVQAGPLPAHINPTNGLPFVQVVAPRQGGMVSPPPSRNFR